VHSKIRHPDEPHSHRPSPTPVRTLPPALGNGRNRPEREGYHDLSYEVGDIECLVWLVPIREERASPTSFCSGYEIAHSTG